MPGPREDPVAAFHEKYKEGDIPWDIDHPHRAFVKLADAGEIRGRVLDAGCGTGENALFLAAQGFDVTGVDGSPVAIAEAEGKARERGLTVAWRVMDARCLQEMAARFDTVIDAGLFHSFRDADRAAYLDALRAVTEPGGRVHVLAFSEHEPGNYGPRRIPREDFEAAFSRDAGWELTRLELFPYDTTDVDDPAKAWLVSARREPDAT